MIGKAGVKVGFIALLVWLSCIVGNVGPFLVGGAVLYLENDEWLKKQVVSMLITYTAICLIRLFALSYLLDIIGDFTSGIYEVSHWIVRIYGIVTDVIYICMGVRAYRHEAIALAKDMSDYVCSDEDMKTGICPSCGYSVGAEDLFCMKCGQKLG